MKRLFVCLSGLMISAVASSALAASEGDRAANVANQALTEAARMGSRSMAEYALDRGAAIHLVQATLGHSSVATTGRYLHARPSESSSKYLAV